MCPMLQVIKNSDIPLQLNLPAAGLTAAEVSEALVKLQGIPNTKY